MFKLIVMKILFDDDYFMGQAIAEAKKAYLEGEIPVGAIITIDQRIIARAHNLSEKLNDVTAHAEMQAITSASNFLNSKYLSNCTIYVTLEPCVMCMGALFWSKIERIVYATSDPKSGFRKSHVLPHPKTKISYVIREDESSNLLKTFFRAQRE